MQEAQKNSIVVVGKTPDILSTTLTEARKEFKDGVPDVNHLFSIILGFTGYVMTTALGPNDYENGTGYLDPLCDIVFKNSAGQDLPAGSTITGIQTFTDQGVSGKNRRILIIVVSPGNNLVIHDRRTRVATDTECLIVHSTKRDCEAFRKANRIHTLCATWSNNLVDLILMADLFGFEIDKTNNKVLVPFDVPTPAFQ